MSAGSSECPAPRSCEAQDLSALIGILAVIEGDLMAGHATSQLTGRLRDRLERARLLQPDGTERDLRQAINELNHRLRYALGEYDRPPAPSAVPEQC